MRVGDASGRWTGKRGMFIYTTDDNFLLIRACFSEISLPRSKGFWCGSSENAVLQNSTSQSLFLSLHWPTTHSPTSPKASAFQSCLEGGKARVSRTPQGTHKVVLLWERKTG